MFVMESLGPIQLLLVFDPASPSHDTQWYAKQRDRNKIKHNSHRSKHNETQWNATKCASIPFKRIGNTTDMC